VSLDPFARVEEAIGSLRRAIAETADRERSDRERFAKARADERVRHERATETLRQALAEGRRENEDRTARATAEAEDAARTALAALVAEEASTRTEIEERASLRIGELSKRLDEAVWLAETVYEGAENQPRIEVERKREELAVRLEELASVREEAAKRIRKCRQAVPPDSEPDPARLASGLARPDSGAVMALGLARNQVQAFSSLRVAGLFRGPILLPPAVGLVGLGAAAGFLLRGALGLATGPATAIGGAAGLAAFVALAAILRSKARAEVRAAWRPLAQSLAVGEACVRAAGEGLAAERARKERELVETRDAEIERSRQMYLPLIDEAKARRVERLERLAEAVPAKREKIARKRTEALAAAAEAGEREGRALAEAFDAGTRAEEARHRETVAAIDADESAALAARRERWRSAWADGTAVLAEAASLDASLFPVWDDPSWLEWRGSAAMPPAIRIGELAFDAAACTGGLPTDPALAPDGPTAFAVPAVLPFPHRAGLVVETDAAGRERAIGLLQAAILRILVRVPPGKVRLTIVDPVGLGQGFAGFMHLADEDEKLVGDRIWTDPRHVEHRLLDLTEHMETVIQKYLRNEFPSIEAYNEKAGEIAEPLRYLVVCDFPHAFSDVAAKRLNAILASGPRCGVHVLLHRDVRGEIPAGIEADDLARAGMLVRQEIPKGKAATPAPGRLVLVGDETARWPFTPDAAPPAETLIRLVRAVGKAAKSAGRVEVPFATVAPQEGQWWSESSAKRLRVPLGRAGATRIQQMTLGEGTSQHALIAGKTGSGKSTLLHALITSVACWYSPREVEFWLVDFKKGVEFMTYATHRLPHARAVAVESDREFGLSVLQGLDAELKRRGDLYRSAGVQDLAGFRAARPDEPMPRSLLIIDEFQELFVEDDKVAQESSLLLDRLVRQGRAFGMHVILGSQTLGGAYSIARATMGQMGVRIALQCSEADSQLILSDDNAAARLLTRPGEAIYNDAGGLLEGNSPFQVVWLPDAVRESFLAQAQRLADERKSRSVSTIVFEGNVPADAAANAAFARLRSMRPDAPAAVPAAWLGEAIAIKAPTACPFRRQGGANLLLVGQQDEAACGTVAGALVSLAVHGPRGSVPITLFDGTPADDPRSGVLARTLATVAPNATVVAWREVEEAIRRLAEEVERRQREPDGNPPAFVVIHALQRYRQLRKAEDDFGFSSGDGPPSAASLLAAILRDGPPVGVHAIVQCDTVANLQRTLDRNTQREFDWKVLFQMSASDSSTLIDGPAASRLGAQRAILFSEELGTAEKFRPWKVPDEAYLAGLTND
jgi:S-DNA-T family DNA segregation ATPase FtsK/SpoIIIE